MWAKASRNTVVFLANPLAVVAVINMFLAMTVLLRDIVLASYLGTSTDADAFLLAMFIPDTIGNLLLAASIGIACVPFFSRLYVNRDFRRLGNCVRGTGIVTTVATLTLIVLGYVYAGEIINTVGKGLSEQTKQECLQLYTIFLPILLFYPLTSIGASLQQVYNRFVIPALGPVLFNLVFLGGIIICPTLAISENQGVKIISAAVTAGTLAALVLVWGSVICKTDTRQIIMYRDESRGKLIDLKNIAEVFFPYLWILLTGQCVSFVERFIASQLEVGSIASLNYAYRLSQFPIWVFVSALGVVILPAMSKAVGLGDEKELRSILLRAVWFVLLITFPMTIIIFGLRVPIVAIFLQHGAFDSDSLKLTASILAGYSLVIVSQSLTYVFLRLYLAWQKLTLPLAVGLAASVVNIAADFLLARQTGAAALGYGAALGALINTVVMILMIKKRLNLSFSNLITPLSKLILANLPVLAWTIFFNWVWPFVATEKGEILKILYALAVALSCSLSYLFILFRLKILRSIYLRRC